MTSSTPESLPVNGKRRRAMIAIGSIFALAAIAFALYWFLIGRYYEKTDNAYVQGNIVQITPQIAGTVINIYADDTDNVKKGQPLVALDPADAQVAAAQAEAQLAQMVREVRTLYANRGQAEAGLSQRQADQAKAEDDLGRRRKLAGTGAVSGEEIRHAEAALAAALAATQAAKEQVNSGRALTAGTSIKDHPNVQRAAGKLREALLAVQRSTLLAPVDGQVAKRSVQVGQRVSPGTPLLAVIPLSTLWVDANFKEGQLRDIRIGQPVTLVSDVYGSGVKYDGRILGLAAGTGGAFSLLPAQNATGNWIKVVQRLPVRIGLDARELAEHPLRVGLSMTVEVDLHDSQGALVGSARPLATPVYQTEGANDHGAQARIDAIIAANLK